MSGFTLEVEADDDKGVVNARELLGDDDLRAGLDQYPSPNNVATSHPPICAAKVGDLSPNIQGQQKTHWLQAEIHQVHLGQGEPTSRNSTLSAMIRLRGKACDDCGHIVARSLGGKMVDFNLFPQNRYINRGWEGWAKHWRRGVELEIEFWLTNPSLRNPRVEFQVRFFYEDQQYKNRPNRAKYLIAFKCDGREGVHGTGGRDEDSIPPELYTVLKGGLQNDVEKGLDSVSAPIRTKFLSLSTQQFKQFVLLLLNENETVEQYHHEPTSASAMSHPKCAPLKYK